MAKNQHGKNYTNGLNINLLVIFFMSNSRLGLHLVMPFLLSILFFYLVKKQDKKDAIPIRVIERFVLNF